MKTKAIIFDLDGTLINSLGDIADTMNSVLKINGFNTHSEDAYRMFVGRGIEELILGALPMEMRDEKNAKEYTILYRQEYQKRCLNRTAPYDGILEMLQLLKENNIVCSILSNKSDKFTKMMVSEIFPAEYFKEVLGSRDGVPIKPDPSAAIEIAQKCNITPDNFLFVGDSGVDMETGKSAGMIPVGVSWGFRDRDELEASGAYKVITRPEELLSLVDGTDL